LLTDFRQRRFIHDLCAKGDNALLPAKRVICTMPEKPPFFAILSSSIQGARTGILVGQAFPA
jgi:hypothetical protein